MRKFLLSFSLLVSLAASRPVAAQEDAQVSSPRFTPSSLDDRAPRERVSLRDAVRRAISRNPQARLADDELHRAEAILAQTRAVAMPRLLLNGAYTRIDDDRRLADRILQQKDQLNANLTLTVPIVAPPLWANWSRASSQVDVQAASASDTRRTVAVATARAYLTVIAQKRILEASERALGAAQAHADFARSRFRGGVGNRLDLVRAEQEVAQTERDAQSVLAALTTAREALGVLAGTDGPVDATDDAANDLGSPRASGNIEQRADVRAARIRIGGAEHSLNMAYTDFLPVLSGQFVPFYQNPATLTTPETGWSAQLLLNWPLYDGGLRYGQQAERSALHASAREALVGLTRQAKSDERVADEATRRSDLALTAARRGAKLAAEGLELANLAYRVGTATNIEVVDAERRLRDAEAAVAVAEDAARRARLDALVAVGAFP